MNYKVILSVFLFVFVHVRCAIIPIRPGNNGKAGLREDSSTNAQRIYLGESSDQHDTIAPFLPQTGTNRKFCDQCRNTALCAVHGNCKHCDSYCAAYETEAKRDTEEVGATRDEDDVQMLNVEDNQDEVVQMVHNPSQMEETEEPREAEAKEGRKQHHHHHHHGKPESRYYTMGALFPGRALDILLSMSSMGKVDVDKAVILVKSSTPLKFDDKLLEKIGDEVFLKIFEEKLTEAEKRPGGTHLTNAAMDNILDYVTEKAQTAEEIMSMNVLLGNKQNTTQNPGNETVGCSQEESETVPFFPLQPPQNLYRSHEQPHKSLIVEPQDLDGMDDMERAKNPGVIQGSLDMRSNNPPKSDMAKKQTSRAREIIDTISKELKGLENMNFVGSPNAHTRDMEEEGNEAVQDLDQGEQIPNEMGVKVVSVENESDEEDNGEARTHKKNKKYKKMKGQHSAPYGYDYGHNYGYHPGYYRAHEEKEKPEHMDEIEDPRTRTHKKKKGGYGTSYRNNEQSESVQIPETDIKLDKKKFLNARPELDSHDGLPKPFHDGLHTHFKKIQEANKLSASNDTKIIESSTVQYPDDANSEESDEDKDAMSLFSQNRKLPKKIESLMPSETSGVQTSASPTVGAEFQPSDIVDLRMENRASEDDDDDGSFENENARRDQGATQGQEHHHHDSNESNESHEHHHDNVKHPGNKGHHHDDHDSNESHEHTHSHHTFDGQQGRRLEQNTNNVPAFIPGKIDDLVDVHKGESAFPTEESKIPPVNANVFNVGEAAPTEMETDLSNIVGGQNTIDNPSPASDTFNEDNVPAIIPGTSQNMPIKKKVRVQVTAGKTHASAPAYRENKQTIIHIPNENVGITETPALEIVAARNPESDNNIVAKKIEKLMTPQEQDFLHNFGKIVPAAENMNLGTDTDVYFMGNGIKLPLKVSQNPDGTLSLAVDIEKLCKCKNSSCIHTKEIINQLDHNLLGNSNDQPDDKPSVAIETKSRKARHHVDFSRLYKNYNRRHHLLHKRSIDVTSDKNNLKPDIENAVIKESSDEIGFRDVKDMHKFTQKAKELEEKLEKLDENVQQSNKIHDDLVQKGTKDFLQIKDEDQVVKQRIELVNDFLNWLKEVAKGVVINDESKI